MHTETTKTNISEGMKRFFADRPRDFGICLFCDKEFERRKNRPDSKCCSKSCTKSYQYKDKRAARPDFRNYQADCQFRFALKDYPDRFDFSLVEEHGWYSAANRGGNLGGVSRDHMFSISDGFAAGVSPDVIRHPANCKLVRQTDNSKKHASSSISLEDLLDRIAGWSLPLW